MSDRAVTRRLSIFINDKEVVNSLSGIGRALTVTNRQLRNLDASSETFEEDLARLSAQSEELTGRQAELRREIHGTSEEMGAAAGAWGNLLTGLKSGNLTMAATGLQGIKAAIIATTRAAIAFIATPIGATIAVLAGVAAATKAWFDYNTEVAKSNTIFAAITKQSGIALDNVRLNSQALANSFNKDAEEIANVASALVTEFGITYDEAFAQIQEGFVKGGAASDEFLESMREYPTFFAQAGFSVSEFQNLLNTGVDLSIYQDKLPDAIKEFSLSVTEGTLAARDALYNAFGTDFTDNLLKGVKNGSISVKESLTLVAQEAERIGLNAQQAAQLTADLFKGAGEDAGGAIKIFDAVNQSIENAKRPLSEVEQAVKDLAQSEKDLAVAQDEALKSDGFLRWKVAALEAFNQVKNGFYTTIAAITNTDEELAAQSKRKEVDSWGKDAIAEMDFYLNRRKKRLGDQYDFEIEKESYLKTLREQAARMGLESLDAGLVERLGTQIKVLEQYQEKVAGTNNKFSQAEIEAQKAAAKKAADEAEKNRKAKLKADLDAEMAALNAYMKGEQELNDLLRKATEDREAAHLTGLKKEIKQIENKYAEEILKYKDHTTRLVELEAAREADIQALKAAKAVEYALEIDAINAEIEQGRIDAKYEAEAEAATGAEERQQILINKAREIAELEIQTEREKELAKVEDVANAEELKQAIRDKYAQKSAANTVKFDKAEKAIRSNQVKWTEMTEGQKLDTIKNALNGAAEAFNKGSNAWKAIKIAEATITTAQAAINSYNSLADIPVVGPALGALAAAAAIAIGVKQISTISKTKIEKAPKFYKGGFTGSNVITPDEHGGITGTTHANEWVAPAYMTQSPKYANVIQWLENERLGKTSPAPPLGGSGTTGSAATGAAAPAGTDAVLLQSILNRLDNPIAPVLVYSYEDLQKHNKMNAELTSSAKNAKLNQ